MVLGIYVPAQSAEEAMSLARDPKFAKQMMASKWGKPFMGVGKFDKGTGLYKRTSGGKYGRRYMPIQGYGGQGGGLGPYRGRKQIFGRGESEEFWETVLATREESLRQAASTKAAKEMLSQSEAHTGLVDQLVTNMRIKREAERRGTRGLT